MNELLWAGQRSQATCSQNVSSKTMEGFNITSRLLDADKLIQVHKGHNNIKLKLQLKIFSGT
jgi:hypothetical protein